MRSQALGPSCPRLVSHLEGISQLTYCNSGSSKYLILSHPSFLPVVVSMSPLDHVTSRHSPPHVRKSALAKTARSALATTHSLAYKTSKHRRPIPRERQDRADEEVEEEQEEDCNSSFDEQDCPMASSFLQYWCLSPLQLPSTCPVADSPS